MKKILLKLSVFVCTLILFSIVLFPLVDSLTKANVAKANPGAALAESTFKINKTSVKPSKTVKASAKIKWWGEKAPGVYVQFDIYYAGPSESYFIGGFPVYTDSKGKAKFNFTLADVDPYYIYAGDTYWIECWAWDDWEGTWHYVGGSYITAKRNE